mgnify:CR=1 FL=1|tara:strand:+ start:3311 stop:4405 length:1095 start_codon:yes stop_codon:yes gene_type:complete
MSYIEKFIKNKVFLEKKNLKISEEELDFLIEVFQESKYLNKKFVQKQLVRNSISLLDSNYEYDSYAFKYNEENYLLKINEGDEESILENEFEMMNFIKNKKISSIPIVYESINLDLKVDILLFKYEDCFSSDSIPKDIFNFNLSTFANTLSFLHETRPESSRNEIEDFVIQFEYFLDFQDFLTTEKYIALSQDKNYIKSGPIVHSALEFCLEEFNETNYPNYSLCHCDLKPSRVLFREGAYKFINFENSFFIDPIIDLCLTIFNFGINTNKTNENVFVESYYNSFNLEKPEKNIFIENLEQAKSKVVKLVLIKNFFDFYMEICVYGYSRPTKFIEFMKKYESIKEYLTEGEIKILDDVFYIVKK